MTTDLFDGLELVVAPMLVSVHSNSKVNFLAGLITVCEFLEDEHWVNRPSLYSLEHFVVGFGL